LLAEGPRHTEAVEVEWGVHPAGEKRQELGHGRAPDDAGYARERFRVDLSTGSVLLERQGDYVVWGAGIDDT